MKEKFYQEVTKLVERGVSRQRAVILVARRHPDLHRAAIAEVNSEKVRATHRAVNQSAIPRFTEAVASRMRDRGLDRVTACKAVAREEPALHAEYLAATNPHACPVILDRLSAGFDDVPIKPVGGAARVCSVTPSSAEGTFREEDILALYG